MRINNLRWLLLLGVAVVTLGGCSSANTTLTPTLATRGATQTPWVIYVPVTVTPEPATITPLPTVGVAVEAKTPTRTPTKAPVVVAKTATKAATAAPVAVAPLATTAPACNLGSVAKLIFPADGALRRTKLSGFAPDTFDFQWTPAFNGSETDPLVGYRIDIQSKKGSKVVNADIVDVQHNWFINNGHHYLYDQRRVQNLASPAGGDTVLVIWTVAIIKTTGSYDNVGGKSSGTVTLCGPAAGPFSINLEIVESS